MSAAPGETQNAADSVLGILAASLALVAVVVAILSKLRSRSEAPTSPTRLLFFTPLLAAISVIALSGPGLFFPGNARVRWAATVISFASSIGIFVLLIMYRRALWASRKADSSMK